MLLPGNHGLAIAVGPDPRSHHMTRIRTGRALSLVSATMVVIAGCGDGGKASEVKSGTGGAAGSGSGGAGGTPPPLDASLAAYTLSYRSGVRVPAGGQVMTFDAFADQVAHLDPIAAKRCPVSHDAEFQTAAD